MYQTVGHQAIELYSEAMGLPLYRRTIQGSAVEQGKVYKENENDEVEDLYELLKDIQVNKLGAMATVVVSISLSYTYGNIQPPSFISGRQTLSSLSSLTLSS